jgi:hypothetical protein
VGLASCLITTWLSDRIKAIFTLEPYDRVTMLALEFNHYWGIQFYLNTPTRITVQKILKRGARGDAPFDEI